MAEHESQPASAPGEADIPAMQKILDSPFLLLFIGIAIPTIFYLIWGILEVANIPVTK